MTSLHTQYVRLLKKISITYCSIQIHEQMNNLGNLLYSYSTRVIGKTRDCPALLAEAIMDILRRFLSKRLINYHAYPASDGFHAAIKIQETNVW